MFARYSVLGKRPSLCGAELGRSAVFVVWGERVEIMSRSVIYVVYEEVSQMVKEKKLELIKLDMVPVPNHPRSFIQKSFKFGLDKCDQCQRAAVIAPDLGNMMAEQGKALAEQVAWLLWD